MSCFSMEEDDRTWAVRYYCNQYIPIARLKLKEGNTQSAAELKAELVEKLRRLGRSEITEAYLEILKQADWSSSSGLEDFVEKYEQAKVKVNERAEQ